MGRGAVKWTAIKFWFQLGHSRDFGTPKQRFENNKQAIRLAKELASTACGASPEGPAILSKYVGWGDSRLALRVHELSSPLTEDDLHSARGSTLNAHYTALPVIGAMWEAALQLGFGERSRKLSNGRHPNNIFLGTYASN